MTQPTPRGVRNRNPGNIDFNPRNALQGQLGLEEGVAKPRFVRFDESENAIRALGKRLINYRGKDGMTGWVGRVLRASLTCYKVRDGWKVRFLRKTHTMRTILNAPLHMLGGSIGTEKSFGS
ncbi:hypothetical protein [Pseudomonas plecoglossicida]